jgi:hypothetical protein
VEAEFLHAGGRADMTKLLVAFGNFSNAPIYETILTQQDFQAGHSPERNSLNEVPSLKTAGR